MGEGDGRELASPTEGQGASAEDGHDVVADILGAVEGGVGTPPAAVDGAGALGLRNDVLEGHLGK